MSRKKFSKEFKLERIKDHEKKGISFYKLEKEYGIELGSIRRWHEAYKVHGEEALEKHNSNSRYTAEFKQQVVNEYLKGKSSYLDLAIKHGINAESTVAKWVKLYNNHEELTDSRPEGGRYLMVKDIGPRKTTQEERISIVEYCIAHGNDYAGTSKKYNCSYGQVYTWVRKYQEKGIDGLKDGRGKNKSGTELSEVEQLKAEKRMLEAELKQKQMEIDFLKKLEDVERR